MGDIVITGLASNDHVPGSYIDVQFAQGQAAGSSGPRSTIMLGNKLAAGTATVDTVVYGPTTPTQCQTETDAIALFGAGSELHRMFRRFVAVNKTTPLYMIAVTQSAGAQATATLTVTVTATASGTARWFVGDESVDSPIVTGDSVTAVAAAGVAAINSMTHWPVTASNSSGVITLTARQAGLRGNWIRFMAQIIGTGVGSLVNGVGVTADAFMTGGSTADSNTAALATIASTEYYRYVSAAEDATQLAAVKAQLATMAAPTSGKLQVAFAGSVDTLSNVNTIATGLNNELIEITWLKKGPLTPAELAANECAIEALFEDSGTSPRLNFAGFGNDASTASFWFVKASRDSTAAPTRSDISSAINSGVSPIGVNANGSTYLVNRVTTRSLNGSVVDYRIQDRHKVTVCHFFAKDANAKNVLNYSGKTIADDPARGAPVSIENAVTPSIYRGGLFGLINAYEQNGLLKNVADIKAGTVVQRASSPTSRMLARVPLQPADCLFQIGVVVAQVG